MVLKKRIMIILCVVLALLSLAGCQKVVYKGTTNPNSHSVATEDEVVATPDSVEDTDEKDADKGDEEEEEKATADEASKDDKSENKKDDDKKDGEDKKPTEKPTEAPTEKPTEKPTEAPTEAPTEEPTEKTEYEIGETSREKPAPKGTWVDYKVRDYNTLEMFTTKVKINDITTQSEDEDYVKEVLDDYNESHLVKLDTKNMSAKIEIVVADIEMKIPKGESVEDRLGAPHPISFDIVRPKGIDYQDKDGDKVKFVTYVGKFEEYSTTCSAGDTVKTKLIYGMVKGFDDYYIKVTSFSDFDGGDCDYAYLNIKKEPVKVHKDD